MPSHASHISSPTTEPEAAVGRILQARVRAELAAGFTLPPALLPVTQPLHDLSAVIDIDRLAAAAAAASNGRELSFTLISKEYIRTGLNWIAAMQRIGLRNFLVVAGDRFTADQMDARGIPNVLATIEESASDPLFVTHDGFTRKGLAMIALKFPVAKFLLSRGYSVFFSDADAVWLQDPMPYVGDADIAFQRIIYHPPAVASLWGFAACTGFVYFRRDPKTIAFVDRCIVAHRSFHCDQVAMNVALLEGDPAWRCEQVTWIPPSDNAWDDQGQRRAEFGKRAQFPIKGQLRSAGLQVLALQHDRFWRHGWVTGAVSDMVICHPNSPKHDLEKIKALNALGICFVPEVADRG